jgi:hypothetical protein
MPTNLKGVATMTQKFVRYSSEVEEHLACDFRGGTPVPLSKLH